MIKVQVLLSTYNGEKYIKEQIESIFNQKNVEVEVIIRDDGSTDKTVDIIKKLQYKYKRIYLIEEENIGAKASFYKLVSIAKEGMYTAFCDQDDVWLEDKLYMAVSKMERYSDEPCMYYSNLNVVNELLEAKGKMYSMLYKSNLGESITYNEVVGCTLVINTHLLKLVKKFLPSSLLCFHDQWISAICSCFKGKKIADNSAYILYRQHANNVVGSKETIKKRIIKSSFVNGKNMRCELASELLKITGEYLEEDINKELYLLGNYKKMFMGRSKLLKKKYHLAQNTFHKTTVLAILLKKY